MPVNRTKLQTAFTKRTAPAWPCPTCGAGHLRLDKKTVTTKATAESVAEQDHPAWDAHMAKLRFVGMAVCDNSDCMESATISGKGGVWPIGQSYNYEEYYEPEYFCPSPHLIAIPATCSDDVKAELRASFSSAWGDPGASSAHVRTAVERALDQLRIPKSEKTKAGARKQLTLHARIERLSARNAEASELLLAVKWIGNAGVHTGALTKSDLANALDILEQALDLLFNPSSVRVRRLAKSINKRKGP